VRTVRRQEGHLLVTHAKNDFRCNFIGGLLVLNRTKKIEKVDLTLTNSN
jgi:hypothetical protein